MPPPAPGQPPYQVYPYGPPYGQPWAPPPRRPFGFRAPVGEPRPYPQLLRSPGFRWWQPLVSIAAGVGVTIVALIGIGVVTGLLAAVTGQEPEAFDLTEGPIGFVVGNLLLAAAIPIAIAAVALGFLRPPTWLFSVVLRIRWRWLAVCTVWLTVWAVAGTVFWFVLDGLPSTGGEDAALLIVLCFLTTPLQAAGEEFLTRGWLTQTIGSCFARPVLGAVVAGVVSALVFALLHGTQNAWLFGDRLAFGLVASYLVWRTGGLEAAIVLHAIANISAIIPAALEGTLDDSLTITEAPIGTVAIDVVMLVIAGVLVVWLARRRGVERFGPLRPEAGTDLAAPVAAG
jgi:membrane protease YdiL (CAAX protease family)